MTDTHPILRFLAFQVLCTLLGLGVFLAYLLGATVAQGGTVTLDMTVFNEMWIEYWLMVAIAAIAPWGLFYAHLRYTGAEG